MDITPSERLADAAYDGDAVDVELLIRNDSVDTAYKKRSNVMVRG